MGQALHFRHEPVERDPENGPCSLGSEDLYSGRASAARRTGGNSPPFAIWTTNVLPPLVHIRRSYRNTLARVRDVADRMAFEGLPLIVTDGFDFYEKVVPPRLWAAALYAQVLKTRRNDRIVKVERRAVHGAP